MLHPAPALPKSIEPTPEALSKVLTNTPVLWVGAGLSVAAGYPSTQALVKAMAQKAADPIDTSLPFFAVVDAFVASEGQGALGDLLQEQFGAPRQPTATHRAIARLAKARRFYAIVTTNYDPLLEHALAAEGVPYLLQPLEDNAPVVADAHLLLLKVHGSYDDWLKVVLSGRSYAEFSSRYPFLEKQLYVLLRQRPLLFTGCSFQDPRLINWIAALSTEEAQTLKQWRLLITEGGWKAALAYRHTEGGVERSGQETLIKARVRPLLLKSYDDLPSLFGAVAAGLAPNPLVIELNLRTSPELSASVEGCPQWAPSDPLATPGFAAGLDQLRTLASKPLSTDEQGRLSPQAASDNAALHALAERIGSALTEALLSSEARAKLEAAINASLGTTPPLLLLRVHTLDNSEAERRKADRLLSLPWELLRLRGEFPVEHGVLDIAREAVVRGATGLTPPDQELTVVATVAAPVDAVSLNYEDECYRLWLAMGAEERRLLIADTGMEAALLDAVRTHSPLVLHFTGHGGPGTLLFEDETAHSAPRPVHELIGSLRGTRLPRLVFLASCYSASVERHEHLQGSHRMVDPAVLKGDPASSSAAELHRAGIHQVVAWLGPVGDAQCTRAEEFFYAVLVKGRTAREAVREARQVCRKPLGEAGRNKYVYPLGWAQLVLYHRGQEVPVALPATTQGADLGRAERKRLTERLDQSAGIVGVERLKFGFIGRRTGRARLLQRFREGCRVLVVQGLGGLGKTALCTEMAPVLARELGGRDRQGKPVPVRIVALDGRFAGQQVEPVKVLWDQVQAFGKGEDWDKVLADLQTNGLTGKALAEALVRLGRQEGGLLIYLDDAESLQVPLGQGEVGEWKSAELKAFWEGLLEAAAKEKQFAVLASTRYVPEGVPSEGTYPLPLMTRIDMVRMVPWWPAFKQLEAEDIAWLVEQLDGHPRSIQWLNGWALERMRKKAAPGQSFTGNLRQEVLEPLLKQRQEKLNADLLLRELMEAAGNEAEAHLRRCTVLEEPAPWGAIAALEDKEGTGEQLARTGLLSAFEPLQRGEPYWAVHRVVADAVGSPAGEEQLLAHKRLGQWFKAQWEKVQGALALAEGAARHLCKAREGGEAWEPTLRLVLALRNAGRYREALERVERVLGAGVNGANRGNALALDVQLKGLLGDLPADAEARLKEAVDLVADVDRAFVLSELGGLFMRQGRLQDAQRAFEQSVELSTRMNGEEHHDVAASLHALAGVLSAQGDLAGARERLERSLRIKAKVFGTEEHPSVAASLHELAGVLRAQGDLAGARERLERSLRIKAKVFGTEEHPDVAASLHALAGVLRAQGDLAGARERLERSLRIKAKVFGTEEHPDVATSLHALAGVLSAQGGLAGARERLERSLRISAKVFGTEEHPDVAASLHALAGVLSAQGDLAGARERLERVLAIDERIYGTRDHYVTAQSEVSLGMLLLQSGEPQRAAQLLIHAYQTFLAQLGPEHPETQQLVAFLRSLMTDNDSTSAGRER